MIFKLELSPQNFRYNVLNPLYSAVTYKACSNLRKMLGKAVSHFHDRKVIAIKVNKTSPPTKKNSITVPQKTLKTKLLKNQNITQIIGKKVHLYLKR